MMIAGASGGGSSRRRAARAERSTSTRGMCASVSGNLLPGAVRISDGALSARMCASSRSPDLGLIGTIGTPAPSAPTTATQVSISGVAHTATRGAASTTAAT